MMAGSLHDKYRDTIKRLVKLEAKLLHQHVYPDTVFHYEVYNEFVNYRNAYRSFSIISDEKIKLSLELLSQAAQKYLNRLFDACRENPTVLENIRAAAIALNVVEMLADCPIEIQMDDLTKRQLMLVKLQRSS